MLTAMTLFSPAGLGLYFFIGGIFACIQVVLINLMRPKIRAEIQAELRKNPPKKIVQEEVQKASSNLKQQKAEIEKVTKEKIANRNRKRNAGKQHRHK